MNILIIRETKITFRVAPARIYSYRLYLKVSLLFNIIACFTDQINFLVDNRRLPQRNIRKRLKLSCWSFCVWSIYLFLFGYIFRSLSINVYEWRLNMPFHNFYFFLSEIVFFYTLNFRLDGESFTHSERRGGIN